MRSGAHPSARRRGEFEEAMREEDVSAEQPAAEEEARLPAPDADPRGTSDRPQAARQGPQEPVRLIWRVRDRASFRALASGRRCRRGALTVTCAAVAPSGPPRVAFSVGRAVGPAVRRNRLRRQLRAAVRENAAHLTGGCAYLVSAAPKATEYSYADLSTTLGALLVELEPARE
jgi:ribonuclease P protein component